jgi:hypothetical protein
MNIVVEMRYCYHFSLEEALASYEYLICLSNSLKP